MYIKQSQVTLSHMMPISHVAQNKRFKCRKTNILCKEFDEQKGGEQYVVDYKKVNGLDKQSGL